MSGYANTILGGASKLIRAAIQSPNYVPATSGWTVNKDGSAEFNNLTIRGTFAGLKFIINTLGAFFYSGTPALGNLVASITSAAGANDGLGNAFLADVTVYGSAGTIVQMLAAAAAKLNIGSGDVAETTPAFVSSAIFGSGGPRFIQTILGAAKVSGQDPLRDLQIILEGDAVDHSFPPDLRIEISADSTTSAGVTFTPTSFLFRGSPSNMFFIDLVNKLLVAGYPIYGVSSAGTTTPDMPHNTALSNGWANQGGGLENLHHWMKADNCARLQGVINSALMTSTTFTTLPAAYRPTVAQDFGVGFHTGTGYTQAAFLRVATTGVCSIINATTTTGVVCIDAHIELDPTT